MFDDDSKVSHLGARLPLYTFANLPSHTLAHLLTHPHHQAVVPISPR